MTQQQSGEDNNKLPVEEMIDEDDSLENACRLCLTTEQTRTSIFGVPNVSLPFVDKISTCLAIQVSADDKFPTVVCTTCINKINQWYSYKDICSQSQQKLQQWFTKKFVTIKSEPVDYEYSDGSVQLLEESVNEAVSNSNSMDVDPITSEDVPTVSNSTNDTATVVEELQQSPAVEVMNQDSSPLVQVKIEPVDTEDDEDDYEEDTPPDDGEPRKELLLNPLAKNRIIEADSTQKLVTKRVVTKKKIRRSTRTHFKGVKLFKKKCLHCKINLHSKFSYQQHMLKYHGISVTRPITGTSQVLSLQNYSDNLKQVEVKNKVEPVPKDTNIQPTVHSLNDVTDEKEYEKMIESNRLTPLQINIISQLKTFSCYTCKTSFFDRRHTLNHIRLHTPDLRPFTCIACLTAFSDRSMYKLHCNASFECALNIALVVPESGEEKYFTCNMCLRSFNNRKEILDHIYIHSHKQGQKSQKPLPKLKPIAALSTTSAGPYANGDPAHNHECDLCGMIYKYRPNVFKHRELCLTLPEHIRTSYRCAHCSMTYLVFQKFYTHIYTEHKTRVITCYTCRAMFQSSDDYLTHHETHRVISKKDPQVENSKLEEQEQEEEVDESVTPATVVDPDKPFNCALCNESFPTPAELSEHRNLHLKVKIYSCVICRNMFSNASTLAQHMKEHGIDDQAEKLNLEGANETNPTAATGFNSSLLTDSSRRHKCPYCPKTFSNYPNMKRHERNLHVRRKRRWSCHLCKRRFKSADFYENHLKIDHGSNKPPQPAAPVATQVSPSTGRPMLQCPKCPRTFAYQGNLIIHCQNIHKENHFERAMANATAPVIQPKSLPPPPPIIPAPAARTPLPKTAGNSQGHSCDICGKTFREEHSLKVHRGWHLRANMRLKSDLNNMNNINNMNHLRVDENALIPEITITPVPQVVSTSSPKPAKARKSFPNIPPLKQLEKIASLQCQVCADKFSDVAELRNHLWNVHCSKNKPLSIPDERTDLQCELCSVKVSDEVSLENHMKWHAQNPTISNSHQQNNHEDSIVSESSLVDPSQPFHCDICGKFYSNQKVFLRHKKLHKVLPPKAIMNFQSLHSSKRNYCQPCNRSFSTEASLKRHKASPCHVYAVRASQQMQAPESSRKITTTAMVHCPPAEPMEFISEIKQEPDTEDPPMDDTTHIYEPEQQPLQKKRPVRCHICEVVFPNMSVLYKHKQLVHSKVPYAAPGTAKSGTSETKLSIMPIVTTDGLYCCNVCGKKFPGLSNLKQHFSHKHKPKTVSFICYAPGCKMVFPSANALKMHEGTHSSVIFNCNMCDRHVFTRNAIIKHMHNTHKAIYQSGASQSALWTETDLTNYNVKNCQSTACPKCKVKYPNLRALKIHYLKYHDKKSE